MQGLLPPGDEAAGQTSACGHMRGTMRVGAQVQTRAGRTDTLSLSERCLDTRAFQRLAPLPSSPRHSGFLRLLADEETGQEVCAQGVQCRSQERQAINRSPEIARARACTRARTLSGDEDQGTVLVDDEDSQLKYYGIGEGCATRKVERHVVASLSASRKQANLEDPYGLTVPRLPRVKADSVPACANNDKMCIECLGGTKVHN